MNNNGFADALDQLNTLIDVNEKVSMAVLEEAAEYFIEKLKPRIPVSNKNKAHMRDSLKVVVKGDMIQVVFDGDIFYWYLAEHGHKKVNGGKVRGKHFVQNTFDAEGDKIAEIMVNKIIKKMGG